MLKSTETLHSSVEGPLSVSCGNDTRVLTVEIHGDEIRGLAKCPGRVIRYVLEAQTNKVRVQTLLSIVSSCTAGSPKMCKKDR